jgi:hypothetical protein
MSDESRVTSDEQRVRVFLDLRFENVLGLSIESG